MRAKVAELKQERGLTAASSACAPEYIVRRDGKGGILSITPNIDYVPPVENFDGIETRVVFNKKDMTIDRGA